MNTKKEAGFRIRLTKEEKDQIYLNATKNNFRSVSEYLRFLGMNCNIEIKLNGDNNGTIN